MISLTSLPTNAKPTCDQVLKSCDAALNAQVEVNQQLTQQVKNYEAKSALDERIKADQQKELNSPLHSTLTVAAGTTIVVLLLEIATGAFRK